MKVWPNFVTVSYYVLALWQITAKLLILCLWDATCFDLICGASSFSLDMLL